MVLGDGGRRHNNACLSHCGMRAVAYMRFHLYTVVAVVHCLSGRISKAPPGTLGPSRGLLSLWKVVLSDEAASGVVSLPHVLLVTIWKIQSHHSSQHSCSSDHGHLNRVDSRHT